MASLILSTSISPAEVIELARKWSPRLLYWSSGIVYYPENDTRYRHDKLEGEKCAIDLGVMVPAQKILEATVREQVDIIGLSGLITPSLDEVEHVARELQRQGFRQPLLIGGATTSLTHAAVLIDPQYDHALVYVKDASRAVGVAKQLISREHRDTYVASVKTDYARKRIIRNLWFSSIQFCRSEQ